MFVCLFVLHGTQSTCSRGCGNHSAQDSTERLRCMPGEMCAEPQACRTSVCVYSRVGLKVSIELDARYYQESPSDWRHTPQQVRFPAEPSVCPSVPTSEETNLPLCSTRATQLSTKHSSAPAILGSTPAFLTRRFNSQLVHKWM